MQNCRTNLSGTLAHGVLVKRELVAEADRIVATLTGSQGVYLLEDAALHLLGGLVCEGYGEDVAI